MIIDTSVMVAIALREPERSLFIKVLDGEDNCRMSAGGWIELSAVAVRRKIIPQPWLDTLIARFGLIIEPVTVEQAEIGHQAYRMFGIGSGHPARLNIGDCFAYALAKATGEPLLFKGDDFTHTDVIQALPHDR